MGKNLIQQARGKGGPTYKAPSFRYRGKAKHKKFHKKGLVNGTVVDLVHCPGHSAPLAAVNYEDGEKALTVAPEGICVGERLQIGDEALLKTGNVSILKNIPEGTPIHNIELCPGDGGKFVRSSGNFARVSAHLKDKVVVILPSKKQKTFLPGCRASIGVVAASRRVEKPFVKAGKRYHKMRARNKLYPIVSGAAMNVVDHPFGNKRSSRKSKARPAPRNAPPGRKVGMIAPKRTGRKKK